MSLQKSYKFCQIKQYFFLLHEINKSVSFPSKYSMPVGYIHMKDLCNLETLAWEGLDSCTVAPSAEVTESYKKLPKITKVKTWFVCSHWSGWSSQRRILSGPVPSGVAILVPSSPSGPGPTRCCQGAPQRPGPNLWPAQSFLSAWTHIDQAEAGLFSFVRLKLPNLWSLLLKWDSLLPCWWSPFCPRWDHFSFPRLKPTECLLPFLPLSPLLTQGSPLLSRSCPIFFPLFPLQSFPFSPTRLNQGSTACGIVRISSMTPASIWASPAQRSLFFSHCEGPGHLRPGQ